MCGIVGFINKDSKKNKDIIIRKMANKIRHRGPDGEGYYSDEYIAMAHLRLAIIDINNGIQPMYTNNYIIIFNGEIYNYQELKVELETLGVEFKTNSDTEVLLNGYIMWQEKLLDKLRGMYAFAIYNKKTKELFCARDHFGIKPLYYYQNDDVFMFASEIKAFLEHPNFKKELNREVLAPYLEFSFNPSNETFFKNVYALEPGSYMKIKDNKVTIKKYYELKFNDSDKSYEELKEELNEVIKTSVKYHEVSDVEIASYLSSGIDSSYLVSLMKPSKNFTIGYNIDKYNETDYTKELSDKLGIENIVKNVSKEEYIDKIDDCLYYLDEPLSDPSIVSLYYLSKVAHDYVKVVISGEGSDEFFLGYNSYAFATRFAFYNKIPFFLRHIVSIIASHMPEVKGKHFLITEGMKLEDGYVGVNRLFFKYELKKVLNIKYNKDNNIVKNILKHYQNEKLIIKKQVVDINCWLAKDILLKADKMAMANSIEGRTPLVDKVVANFAASIPYQYKVSSNKTKMILRDAAKDEIPTEVYKKKKLGFPVPLRVWMKDEDVSKMIRDEFNKDYVKELFNQKYILKLLDDHINNKKDNYRKVWAIYTFLRWYDIYFMA